MKAVKTNNLSLFKGAKVNPKQPLPVQNFAAGLGDRISPALKVRGEKIYHLISLLPAHLAPKKDIFEYFTRIIIMGKTSGQRIELADKIINGLNLTCDLLRVFYGKRKYIEGNFWAHADWERFNPLYMDEKHPFLYLFDVAVIVQSGEVKGVNPSMLLRIFKAAGRAAQYLHSHPVSVRRNGRRHREIGILSTFIIENLNFILSLAVHYGDNVLHKLKGTGMSEEQEARMLRKLKMFLCLHEAAQFHNEFIMKTEKFDSPIWKHPLVRNRLWEVSLSFTQFLKNANITHEGRIAYQGRIKRYVGILRAHFLRISVLRPKGEVISAINPYSLPDMLHELAVAVSTARNRKEFAKALLKNESDVRQEFGKSDSTSGGEEESIQSLLRVAMEEEAVDGFVPETTIADILFSAISETKDEEEPRSVQEEQIMEAADFFETTLARALQENPDEWHLEDLGEGFATWRYEWGRIMERVQQRILQKSDPKVSFSRGTGTVKERLLDAIVSRCIMPEVVEEGEAGEIKRTVFIPIFKTVRRDTILPFDSLFALNNYTSYVLIKLMELEQTPAADKIQIGNLSSQLRNSVLNTIEIVETLRGALMKLDKKGNWLNIHRDALYWYIDRFLHKLNRLIGSSSGEIDVDSYKQAFAEIAGLQEALAENEVLLRNMDEKMLLYHYKRMELVKSYETFTTMGIEEDLERIPEGSFRLGVVTVKNEFVPLHLRTFLVGRPWIHADALNSVEDVIRFIQEVEITHSDRIGLEDLILRRGYISKAGKELRVFICDFPPKEEMAEIKDMFAQLGFKSGDIYAVMGQDPSSKLLGKAISRS